MAIKIKSPTFPESVSDGTVANWVKKEGETVLQDDVIAEIDLGVFALSTIPLKSVKKDIGERDVDIEFMSVKFKPGNYIYADLDGVIISETELEIN